MLIIGRRPGESIFLGEDVEVKIMDITPSRVKVGIIAPKQVAILRGEVLLAQQQNRAAAQTAPQSGVQQVLQHLRSAESGSTGRELGFEQLLHALGPTDRQ